MNQDKNWWKNFFDLDFSSILLDRNQDRSLEETLNFLVTNLKLKEKALVFDQCCGTGAISIGLAKKGFSTIGIDQAEVYIEQAQKMAEKQNLLCANFEVADAFEYICHEQCDAAINWYSSIGYCQNDDENIKMLNCVYKSLKLGGFFALEYFNVSELRNNFKKVFIRSAEVAGKKIVYEKHSELDETHGMLTTRWVYKFEDGRIKEAFGQSRLYTKDQLQALMQAAGFRVLKIYGDLNSGPCTESSQRCIIIGQKIK